MKLKLSKCRFFCSELPFLGYILSSEGIRPDVDRIQAIVDYQSPKNVKEVQKFLGLCNYDRLFCSGMAEISEPLTRLLRKTVKWNWGAEQQQAFTGLKSQLQDSTLIYFPDYDLPFHVAADSSDFGLGAQLYQVVNGQHRVVAWASRLLLPREKRYSSNEKEVLAAVFAINRWRIYLLGRHFYLHTDNKALTYLQTCRLLSPRITRWALTLQEYDFSIEYIPGPQNLIPDALSRYACVRPPCPEDRCFKIFQLSLPKSFLTALKDFHLLQKSDTKLGPIINQLSTEALTDAKLSQRFV